MAFARVHQPEWLRSDEHMRISEHIGHSSCARIAHVHIHTGSPVLREECRVGQEWEELRKGRQNLGVIRYSILGNDNVNII